MEFPAFQPSPIGPQAAANNYTGFSKKAQLVFYTRLYHLGLLAGSIDGVIIPPNAPLLWQKAYRKIQQTPNYKAREDPVWQLSHNVPAPWFQVLRDMDNEVPPRPPAQHDLEHAERQGVVFVKPEVPCWMLPPDVPIAYQSHHVYAIPEQQFLMMGSGQYHNVGKSFHQQYPAAAYLDYPGYVTHSQQFPLASFPNSHGVWRAIDAPVQPQYLTNVPQPWQNLTALGQPEDDDMAAIIHTARQAAASQAGAVQMYDQQARFIAEAEGPHGISSSRATSKTVVDTAMAPATKRRATDEVPETSTREGKILEPENGMPTIFDQSVDIRRADVNEGTLEDTFDSPWGQNEQGFEDPSNSFLGPIAPFEYGELPFEEFENQVQSSPSMEKDFQPLSPIENDHHPEGFSLSDPIWNHNAVIEEIFWAEK
jgi:hypothetical protein